MGGGGGPDGGVEAVLQQLKGSCGWFLVAETSNTELQATARLHQLDQSIKAVPGL